MTTLKSQHNEYISEKKLFQQEKENLNTPIIQEETNTVDGGEKPKYIKWFYK